MSDEIEAPKEFFQATAERITIVDTHGTVTRVELHEVSADRGATLQYAQVLATAQVAASLQDFVAAFSAAREGGLDEGDLFKKIFDMAQQAKGLL